MVKNMNSKFADYIIELKMLTDKISEGKGIGSGVFTDKFEMLYLISQEEQASPQFLIENMNLAKSNLALLATKLKYEGLIDKIKIKGNKKQIYYLLTERGKRILKAKLHSINNFYSRSDLDMLYSLEKSCKELKKM